MVAHAGNHAVARPNCYAYVGCNPTNYTDPTGAISACTAGSITLTVVGFGLGVATGGWLVAAGATAPATAAGAILVTTPYAAAAVGQAPACNS